jgi:putative transposase
LVGAATPVTVLGALTSMLKTSAQLRLENLALRQQLVVLLRSASKRLKLTPADRIFWVWLRHVWSDWISALMIVKAETVVAWHRKGFGLFWTWRIHHGKSGRPRVPQEVRDLIRMMSRNNPRWGAPRVHGELLKLGIGITEPTVAKYMVRHRKPPSQTWRTFLDNHLRSFGLSGLFHRANGPVPGPVRVSGAGARPAPHAAVRRDRSSDCGMDGPATS